MRNVILAWYAFSESGEATRGRLPAPHRLAELFDTDVSADLDRPAHVAGLFGDARQLDLQVGAPEWKHLFSRYGLTGLIDLAKQRGDFAPDATDTNVAEAIVSESLDAGYDPVSGLIGEVSRASGQFEPTLLPGTPAKTPSRIDFGDDVDAGSDINERLMSSI